MHAGSAREAWQELEERYKQSNAPKLYQMRFDLMNLKQNEDSMINYYNKIKVLWDELDRFLANTICTCNRCNCVLQNSREERRRERINQFLLCLDDEFSVMRGKILSTETIPLIRKVLFLITQEENHKKRMRSGHIQECNSSAMAVNKKSSKNTHKKEKKDPEKKYFSKMVKHLNTDL